MTILQNDGQAKPETVGVVKRERKFEAIPPSAFFKGVQVGTANAVQCMVTPGPKGIPNDHTWAPVGIDFADWIAQETAKRKHAYFSLASFDPRNTGRWKPTGRDAGNVVEFKVFAIDVDGGPIKLAKHGPEKVYATASNVMQATADWIATTKLMPNFFVTTGSGGVHLYYVLDSAIPHHLWEQRAKKLVALARDKGFKIDAPITTDAARFMRAPGSFHQDTGELVQAYSRGIPEYSLDKFDKLVGYVPGADLVIGTGANSPGKYDMTVWDGIGENYPPYSYNRAAEKCGAMRQAAENNGRDTPYPVWILALTAGNLSTEGRAHAHEISNGHPKYDRVATDKKIEGLDGGPAGCEAWAAAYGAGGPCDTCEWRGKIKNPAVQLGTEVNVAPPGEVALSEAEKPPEYVKELNQRFALVRHGKKMVIVDFQTPSMSGRGVVHDMGFLEVGAFIQMHKGVFAPVDGPKDKPRPLANAWLEHQGRRQCTGLVFAPGDSLPANILNLWQGFAVEPVVGDVSLWLEVLEALIPGEADRCYVLNWLAWKIQNPGGVPDTILILKGAKGTGKNSLFDPVILLFGRHAMLADSPELIAGKFSWHLMYLSFAVLDEAVFIQDPRQADRIKSRVTAKTMQYEQKGMDPVQGVNRCAFVMLTNHEYVWQATSDERRAVVIEVGEALRCNLEFWARYHAWAAGPGPAALLHYLQGIDLTGFNPRQIPKGEALRKQIEQTALRVPAAAWWHQCLVEGVIRWRDGMGERVIQIADDTETEIDRSALRLSYEQSAAARGRASTDWAAVSKRLNEWAGPGGIRTARVRVTERGFDGSISERRERRDVLPPLPALRGYFTAATQVQVAE